MRDRQVCIDCGKQSPETETNYTLISAQFGWRLTRRRGDNGDFVVEWRCPDCWRAHKKKTDEAASSTNGKTVGEKGSTRGGGKSSRPPPRSSKPPPTPPSGVPNGRPRRP